MTEARNGIWAKLNRAEEHLNTLDSLIASYFAQEPYRILGEEWMEGEYWHSAIYLQVNDFPPDEVWGPIIGDAVHNLRSALDHLAWMLATERARREKPRQIEFPITLGDPATGGRFTEKLNHLRSGTHAIIDRVQPYKTFEGPQHPLWLLQALWNTDKHRALHTTGFAYVLAEDLSESSDYGFTAWRWGAFGDRFDADNRTLLESGHTLASGLATAHPLQDRLSRYENVIFDVTLGHKGPFPDQEIEPYGGLPIRQVLRRLQRFVTRDVIGPLT